jgi:nitrate reductase NapE component
MRSDSARDAQLEASGESAGVIRLLDSAFGFFVWATHLVIIYVANALACVLGLTSTHSRAESVLVISLAAVTIVAAALVGAHGLRRYPQRLRVADEGFLNRIAVGHDAIALVAILWQLVPIFMSPVCL